MPKLALTRSELDAVDDAMLDPRVAQSVLRAIVDAFVSIEEEQLGA